MKKTQIKMRIVNWWCEDTKENFYKNYFVQLLSKKYDIVYAEKPDFIIFGPFKNENDETAWFDYDCVRIFYTGENVRTDFNVADYGIDFDFMDFGDRHLRKPLSCNINKNRPLNKREKFCAYMVSNGGDANNPLFRDKFFDKLSLYKKVDSGGIWRNNIGGPIGDRYNDFSTSKMEWLKNYKFNLCFENASFPGYLTEKLFDAYNAGCVPIYWGDTSLRVGLVDDNGGGGL